MDNSKQINISKSTCWTSKSKKKRIRILLVEQDKQWTTFSFKTILHSISPWNSIDSVESNEIAEQHLKTVNKQYDIIVIGVELGLWLIDHIILNLNYKPQIILSSKKKITESTFVDYCIQKPFNKKEIEDMLQTISVAN
jgi:hypothetical protein